MRAPVKTARDLLARTTAAGSELRNGVEDLRREIRDIRAQRDAIHDRLPTKEIAFKRLSEWLDVMTIHKTFSVEPERFTRGAHYQMPQNYEDVHVLVKALRPVLEETMRAEIAKLYTTDEGISDEDRSAALAKIEARLLDAELAEESIIRNAEAAGLTLNRRNDADPRAVLAADEDLP